MTIKDEFKKMVGESTEIENTIVLVRAYRLILDDQYGAAFELIDNHNIASCAMSEQETTEWFLHARDVLEPYTEDAIISDLRWMLHDLDMKILFFCP